MKTPLSIPWLERLLSGLHRAFRPDDLPTVGAVLLATSICTILFGVARQDAPSLFVMLELLSWNLFIGATGFYAGSHVCLLFRLNREMSAIIFLPVLPLFVIGGYLIQSGAPEFRGRGLTFLLTILVSMFIGYAARRARPAAQRSQS